MARSCLGVQVYGSRNGAGQLSFDSSLGTRCFAKLSTGVLGPVQVLRGYHTFVCPLK